MGWCLQYVILTVKWGVHQCIKASVTPSHHGEPARPKRRRRGDALTLTSWCVQRQTVLIEHTTIEPRANRSEFQYPCYLSTENIEINAKTSFR